MLLAPRILPVLNQGNAEARNKRILHATAVSSAAFGQMCLDRVPRNGSNVLGLCLLVATAKQSAFPIAARDRADRDCAK
jgi:hypothetical protein